MNKTPAEVRLLVVNLVTDILLGLTDDGETDFDRAERQDYLSKVSEMIFEELDLEIVDVDETGIISATMKILR